MNITEAEKNNFYTLVDSLKKCRRADLSDIGNDDGSIIEKLYVDPLDNDFVLKSIQKLNTTVLTGRRGTGKSTIIARLQHEVRKSKDKLSLYMDVKSIFEQSKSFSYDSAKYENLFREADLKNYLIYKTFLKEIINQIRVELKTNTLKFYLAKIHSVFGPDKAAYEEEISRIFDEIEKTEFTDIEVIKSQAATLKTHGETSHNQTNSFGAKLSADASKLGGSMSADSKTEDQQKQSSDIEHKYSDVLLRCFSPIVILKSIKSLLQRLGISHVYICLDDFSEIELDAMKVFVDVIIAPLNNWSEEFFKFKIAAYPGRVYLGDIDPQKIEQIRLDYYELYQAKTVNVVQMDAQKNIKKLLAKRLEYFCKQPIEYFFDTSRATMDDYYRVIFDISASVPRNVGWVLWYAYQQSIAKDRRINLTDLDIAAEKHFVDTVQPYFSKNMFMREPFNMKLEKFHLNELLKKVVTLAKQNKKEISLSDSSIFQADKARPPTSHFYINKELEDVLLPLELQFYITKYNEQKDQDSNALMSFFSLNYGLCMMEDINYGRGSDRKYVIQRRFNYTSTIQGYLGSAKHLLCNNSSCGASYEYEKLSSLELFDMLCPRCKKGTCEVAHVTAVLPSVTEDLLLSEYDINLLNALNIESPQYPGALASELDCTYQKVGKRAVKLKELGLLTAEKKVIDVELGQRNYYFLSEKAKEIYFAAE